MTVSALGFIRSSNGRKSWLRLTVFVFFATHLVSALFRNQSNNTNEVHHRRLQVEDGGVSSTTGDSRARYIQKVLLHYHNPVHPNPSTTTTDVATTTTASSLKQFFFVILLSIFILLKKSAAKSDRMKRILSVINLKPHVVGNNLKPEPWGAQHTPSGNAIFAVLMNYGGQLSERQDALPFLGSLRKTGYTGDVVLAMSPGYKDGFLDVVKESNVIVYTVPLECGSDNTGEVCNYPGRPEIRASVNMIRFFLYQVIHHSSY